MRLRRQLLLMPKLQPTISKHKEITSLEDFTRTQLQMRIILEMLVRHGRINKLKLRKTYNIPCLRLDKSIKRDFSRGQLVML